MTPRLLVLALLCLPRSAPAAPVTLRFATAAPDGTAWARLFRAMARDIAEESHQTVASKLYFGGIAGTEMEMLDRLERGQLDAVMSGGMLCMKLSPSMRALRLLGLFQSRDESSYILGRLRANIDAEFAKHGMHNVGEASLGSDMLFSRAPITTLDQLKKTRVWIWDLDEGMRLQLQALGISATPLPLDQAAHAYEQGRVDAFLAVPTAALAFQWSAQARYLSELRLGYLPGCMVLSDRAWDSLSVEGRRALMVATARAQARLEDLGRTQDAALLGGLFAKQGLKSIPVSAGFAAEFFEAARLARAEARDRLLPPGLMELVIGWLADYRAEYGRPRK